MQNTATKQGRFGDSYRHFWRNTRFAVVFLLFIVFFTSIFHTSTAHAAQTIPYKINFQGRLADAAGNVKPDGLYNMKLRLFSAATGSTALWTETRDATNRVQVTNGLFSVQLGDFTALSPSIFTNYPLYLEIELPTPATATCSTAACGTFTEGAMTPRSPLGSSPYAFNADTVDGIDGANLARNDVANTFTVGSANTFNAKTQVNDTLSVVNSKAIGFNITQSGSNLQLQTTANGGYIMNDATGLSIAAVANGTAGTTVSAPPTLKLVANNLLIQAAVDAGVTYGDNLISNPGFEFGCAGWLSCDATTTAAPSSGASNYRFTQANTTTPYEILSRVIAVQANDQYYFSTKIKTSATTTGLGGYYIRFMDATGNVVSLQDGTYTNPGTSYITRSSVHTVPAGAVYAALVLTVRGSLATTAGTWDFDDVYAKQVNQSAPVLFRSALNSIYAFTIQNAAGASLFAVDSINNEIRIGDGDVSPDAFPTLLVVDHKSTVGDPSVGYNGSMYYNAFAKKFRCYEGDVWKDCVSTMLDPRQGYNYQSEFTNGSFTVNGNVDPTVITFHSSGALAQQNNDGGSHPGILGATATSTTSVSGYSSFPLSTIALRTGDWSYLSAIKLSALSVSGGIYTFRAGFMNNIATTSEGGVTDGCYIRSTNSVPGDVGKWQGVCRSVSAETVCTIPLTVTTSWTTLNVVVANNGATATFTANDSNQCSVSSGIPTATTAFGAHIHKATGGATAVTVSNDYVDIRGRFSR